MLGHGDSAHSAPPHRRPSARVGHGVVAGAVAAAPAHGPAVAHKHRGALQPGAANPALHAVRMPRVPESQAGRKAGRQAGMYARRQA